MAAEDVQTAGRAVRVLSRVLRGGLGLIVLVVALGAYSGLMLTAEKPARLEIDRRETSVQTVAVREVRVPRRWRGYGTARAMHSADISAQITARVIERPGGIEEGVAVAAGDTIARLDAVDYESELLARESAAAALQSEIDGLGVELLSLNEQLELGEDELKIEQRVLDRYNQAQTRGGANPLDVDQRTAGVRRIEREIASLRQRIRLIATREATLGSQLAQARAQARRAQEDLARATITSPIAGVVQRIEVEEGELLTAGAMVARVVDLSTIEIPLQLPVSSSRTLRVGDRVEVSTDGPSGKRWSGTVRRIAPEADAQRRTITVFAEVRQNPGNEGTLGELLLPGQFVSAEVFSAVDTTYAVLPRGALADDRVLALASSGDGLFSARSVPVRVEFQFSGAFPTIHPTERQWAAVAADGDGPLPERVIVSNLESLRDGSSVRPVDAAAAARGSLTGAPSEAPDDDRGQEAAGRSGASG